MIELPSERKHKHERRIARELIGQRSTQNELKVELMSLRRTVLASAGTPLGQSFRECSAHYARAACADFVLRGHSRVKFRRNGTILLFR